MNDPPAAGIAEAARSANPEATIERLRTTVVEALRRGSAFEAERAARELLGTAPGRRTSRFLHDAAIAADASRSGLRPLKVALLASFSIEFLHDALVAAALAAGFRLEVYQAPFANFRQQIMTADSDLYGAQPDIVVLAVEAEDWTTAPFTDFTHESRSDDPVQTLREEVTGLFDAFRARSSAPLLMHNLALPAWRKLGVLDPKVEYGQGPLLQSMNAAIASAARSARDVHIVDYAALVNRYGALNWYDERMRLYARAPIAGSMHQHLAREYVKYFRALTGAAKKCLVLDLDNTLWGGIVGEDGAEGIALGATYPGSAFVEFQRHVLDLHRRGVILALASKNNPADVDEVFARHPSMVLKREHFAAMEIHWEPKSESLRRISNRLSIGLEHVVFADDNAAECEEVRHALPEVEVLLLPSQPEQLCAALSLDGWFDTVAVSDEDRRRGELYRKRAQAEEARTRAGSLEDYYRDLAMQVAVAPIGGASLARASQLTQKTNQFNVTTRRYAEAELAARLKDPAWLGLTVAVRDRFGDNGIVGVALAHDAGDALQIDSLIMSCRVIGRTIESAMLAQLCDEALARGLTLVRGTVIPTSKNAPSRDVFERHGFIRERDHATGAVDWRLDIRASRVAWPEWLARKVDGA